MCMLMNLRHTEEITYEMRSAAFCVCVIANIVGSFLFLILSPEFSETVHRHLRVSRGYPI